MPENSLINMGDISRPATVLIEKISEAVGSVFKPYQIRRVAEAESDAKVIHAIADIKIQELQHRAIMRFIQEETKKQKNIEDITSKAIPDLETNADPKKMDDDWLVNFFEKCKTISNEEMQKIWAKILAGEANSPGAYSKRTVNIVSNLTQEEALAFQHLCKFRVDLRGIVPIIFDSSNTIYKSEGMYFDALKHFDEIGLINFQALGYVRKNIPNQIQGTYCGAVFSLGFPEKERDLSIGKVMFSQAGLELATICPSVAKEGFLDYIKSEWKKGGIQLTELA